MLQRSKLMHQRLTQNNIQNSVSQPLNVNEIQTPPNQLPSSKEESQQDNKYNPDVIKKFKEINSHLNNIKPEFVNTYYKSITNQPVKSSIKSPEDLKLMVDKPDINKLESNYEIMMRERLQEQNIVKKSINDYNQKNKINETTPYHEIKRPERKIYSQTSNPIQTNEKTQLLPENNDIITELDEFSHLKLKAEFSSYSLKENDKILNEKKRFNKILEDLDSLL